MKKNRILTESQRRQIIDDKQKAIVESFASTFNRIKRIDESEIVEDANTDLELKSVAKKIFKIFKNHGLKPEYKTGDSNTYLSNEPSKGYGGEVILDDKGVLTVGIYNRGVWQTLKELDMGSVSYPSDEEQKQIEQKANQIYNEIVKTLGDDFEYVSGGGEPNQYGYYILKIRKK